VAGSVAHVFTHFSLTLTVHVARVAALPDGLAEPAATVALPSVMRKALNAALTSLDAGPGAGGSFPDA
jgi:A/G-specific adenine glycosylase